VRQRLAPTRFSGLCDRNSRRCRFSNRQTAALTAPTCYLSRYLEASAGRRIEMQVWQDVPFIPMGEYWQATAYRKNIAGMIPGCFSVFWGVKRT